MTKVTCTAVVVRDSHGNEYHAVYDDSCETIQICGMRNSENKAVYFECEAYHLPLWCSDNGLKLFRQGATIDVPTDPKGTE